MEGKRLRTKDTRWVASRTLKAARWFQRRRGGEELGLRGQPRRGGRCRREGWAPAGLHSPEAGLEKGVSSPPAGPPSRGHPLTGQGAVTCNWLMSGGHFEDEKCQVGIITSAS